MKPVMTRLAAATAVLAFIGISASASGEVPLSARDSFRIGSSGTIYCSAQPMAADPALASMFDVGYRITCRDAASPVGRLYKLRSSGDSAARLAAAASSEATCTAPRTQTVEGLGQTSVADCSFKDGGIGYRTYVFQSGNTLYAAQGLAGYDSALRLGLRTLIADKAVDGELQIASTGAGDPAAFARVQAGTLDASKALAEAYRRNNAGSYAEAAEFFAAVGNAKDAPLSRVEVLANEALQKSNLGRYAEANSLLARASAVPDQDPLVVRRLRNYRALHELNQGDYESAIKELDKVPVAPPKSRSAAPVTVAAAIDQSTAKVLNSDSPIGRQLGTESDSLLPSEKQEILDAQALKLRGTALRLAKRPAEAVTALDQADQILSTVRNGNVTSVVWMRAQIRSDLGVIAEERGEGAGAERLYSEAIRMIETGYPGSAALLNARAALAGFYARNGRNSEAEALFREIVRSQPDASNIPPSFAFVLRPYLDILLQRPEDTQANAELFAATQLMVRPGLSQTQSVLARELSGGSDEAARLFRQSVTLTRQIERDRVELARLEALPKPGPIEQSRIRVLRDSLDRAQKQQTATQSSLSRFPRYRAVASEVIGLTELQSVLADGEAYYRMTVVGDAIYATLTSKNGFSARKLDVSAKQISEQVDALRETISTVENGERITYAYDVGLAHAIYRELFEPFAPMLGKARSLVFEPDGAMLRLPPNVLVTDRQSVDAYAARAAAGGDAEFDFRGVSWFGRTHDISTSVSPRSFAQLRAIQPSGGRFEYLGLGQNTPPPEGAETVLAANGDRECILPISNWARPISAKELETAGAILKRYDPNGIEIVTGDSFTDKAIESRTDLDEYRILHFATHGVVTSRAAACPAQPALLTSFGGPGSDGLLTFRDIFDLKLDADLVVLSACDTASAASGAATESAGLATGGDVALDGLVRAFTGAGSRVVIASHWPVPDDYNATQRLVTGLFTAPPGMSTTRALRSSQHALMDEADTSHPFYWGAFAVVGDGERPVVQLPSARAAARSGEAKAPGK